MLIVLAATKLQSISSPFLQIPLHFSSEAHSLSSSSLGPWFH